MRRELKFAVAVSPFVFLLHEIEEAITLPPWLHDNGSSLPDFVQPYIPSILDSFPYAVAIIFITYGLAAAAAIRYPGPGPVAMFLALLLIVRLINGAAHALQSMVHGGYTPGLVTALLIVSPFAFWLLRRILREGWVSRPALRMIVVAGLFVHVAGIVAVMVAAATLRRIMV